MIQAVRAALLLGVGFAAGAGAALVAFSVSIDTPVTRIATAERLPLPGDTAFLEVLALHAGARFSRGHSADILLDGEQTYPRLWSDMRGASRSLTVQPYYCTAGALADTMAQVLRERARAGVRVLFLYDGFACDDLGTAYYDSLREAGVEVREHRPVRWWSLFKAQRRAHSRIVVVDGRLGYTGGFGIDDRWSAHGTAAEPGWRDTNVRFTGPSVAALQAAFADSWAEATGELIVGEPFYRAWSPAPADDLTAALLNSVPDVGSTTAERLLALAIASARETLYIANAYFVPDRDFERLLVAAAARGVDVRILAPGRHTDVPVVRYAARGRYPHLLRGGVRLYEYDDRMMHAKTMVVDGVLASIGSLNFDVRSLAVNEETSLLVQDRAFGARMDSIFLTDLGQATELEPDRFARRGFWERARERLAGLTAGIL